MRSRGAPGYVDRIVVALLAGWAVETMVGLALGRELSRGFENELNATEIELGKLAFRREGSAAWRARTSIQHSGLPPAGEEAQQISSAASSFARELCQLRFGVALETVGISQVIGNGRLRAAAAEAEACLSANDFVGAAQWTSRLVARMKGAVEDYVARTNRPFRWRATEEIFAALSIQGMTDELDAAFAQVRTEALLGHEAETLRSVASVLPVAVEVWGRDVEVIHQSPDYTPEPDAVRWAFGKTLDLAMRLESAGLTET